jgi:dienelactone hydrolase
MRRFLLLSAIILGACATANTVASGDGGSGGGTFSDAGAAAPGSADGGSITGTSGGDDSGASDAALAEASSEDASAGDASSGLGPYASSGPYSVSIATLQVPSPNGTFTTTAYVPSATGPEPVVILSSGFFQNGVAYAPYADRLASWGIVTFLRDDPNLGESTPNIVSDVGYEVSTWLATTNGDSASALHGKIDLTRIGLAGHSRGGQVALLAGEGLVGKIQGVFGLDPVDTSMSGDPEARTTLASIGVPLAFIGETTDSADSGCAPGPDDYLVLYQAAASPAVEITAVGADHTMFEDPANCSFCTLCTKGTANQATVLATAVRYMTAFFARQLQGDTSVGAAFVGAGIDQDVDGGIVSVESK